MRHAGSFVSLRADWPTLMPIPGRRPCNCSGRSIFDFACRITENPQTRSLKTVSSSLGALPRCKMDEMVERRTLLGVLWDRQHVSAGEGRQTFARSESTSPPPPPPPPDPSPPLRPRTSVRRESPSGQETRPNPPPPPPSPPSDLFTKVRGEVASMPHTEAETRVRGEHSG